MKLIMCIIDDMEDHTSLDGLSEAGFQADCWLPAAAFCAGATRLF